MSTIVSTALSLRAAVATSSSTDTTVAVRTPVNSWVIQKPLRRESGSFRSIRDLRKGLKQSEVQGEEKPSHRWEHDGGPALDGFRNHRVSNEGQNRSAGNRLRKHGHQRVRAADEEFAGNGRHNARRQDRRP